MGFFTNWFKKNVVEVSPIAIKVLKKEPEYVDDGLPVVKPSLGELMVTKKAVEGKGCEFEFRYDYCMEWDRVDVYYKGRRICSTYSGNPDLFANRDGWWTEDREVQLKLRRLVDKIKEV